MNNSFWARFDESKTLYSDTWIKHGAGKNMPFMEAARAACDSVGEIDGYAIVAWNKTNSSYGVKWDSGNTNIFDLPSRVSEIIRWSWEK